MFDDIDFGGNEEIKKAVVAAAEAAVQKAAEDAAKKATGDLTGLKKTLDALKSEKADTAKKLNELQTVLEGAGGEDGIKVLQELKAKFENDELGKLLAEGKTTEFIDATTANIRKQFEGQIEKLNEQIKSLTDERDGFQSNFHGLKVDNFLHEGLAESKVHSTAVPDIIRNARDDGFKFDADGDRVVQMDSEGGIKFSSKDPSKPLDVAEWLEGKKESHPHWWPASQGGGAGGSGSGGGSGAGDFVLSKADAQDSTKYAAAKEAAAKAGQTVQILDS